MSGLFTLNVTVSSVVKPRSEGLEPGGIFRIERSGPTDGGPARVNRDAVPLVGKEIQMILCWVKTQESCFFSRLRIHASQTVMGLPAPGGPGPSGSGRSRTRIVGSRKAHNANKLCPPTWPPIMIFKRLRRIHTARRPASVISLLTSRAWDAFRSVLVPARCQTRHQP